MALSIAERMRRDTVTWRPDDNSEHPAFIIGEIIEISEADSGYGPYVVLTIAPDDDTEILWRWNVLGGVASKRVEELGPQEGDRIGVKYKGTKPSVNFKGKDYKDWDIFLERAHRPEPVAVQSERGGPAAALSALRPREVSDDHAATNEQAKRDLGDAYVEPTAPPQDEPPSWLDAEEEMF